MITFDLQMRTTRHTMELKIADYAEVDPWVIFILKEIHYGGFSPDNHKLTS